ncbi:MAG: hypothetical protein H5T47_00230 [Archaeoglobi archaeon]|nr:hypothetical protein [Candidatus Mnemosynella bozhongmuii]
MHQSTCSSERLRDFLEDFSEKYPELIEFCTRVLESRRYGGNVILMIVDAGITSTGVNYFSVVVPRVLKFRDTFILTGEISELRDILSRDPDDFLKIWKNRRSYEVIRGISEVLLRFGDGVEALRNWAFRTSLPSWRDDPMSFRGVGINTFQYLRMMGGIDTVMPDRIVRSFLSHFFELPSNSLDFIIFAERVAREAGFRAVDLCWIAWLSKYDEERRRRYMEILSEI